MVVQASYVKIKNLKNLRIKINCLLGEMENVNFMMDDYQYKMYGIHVEPENENQNCRCWQDILIFQ